MLFWLILVAVAWLLLALVRAVLFVGADMADVWDNNQEYSDDQFRSALWVGFLAGLGYPIALPFKLIGTLLYKLAYKVAMEKTTSEPVVGDKLTEITDEIAKVPARSIAAGGYDVADGQTSFDKAIAATARDDKHRAEDTSVGGIPAYQARHA